MITILHKQDTDDRKCCNVGHCDTAINDYKLFSYLVYVPQVPGFSMDAILAAAKAAQVTKPKAKGPQPVKMAFILCAEINQR